MNDFEKRLPGTPPQGLYSVGITTLQINLGLRCNQECSHCHLEASPHRTEIMDWTTMQFILKTAVDTECQLVDLTGGAPELNPFFLPLVASLRRQGHTVQVRTNLTVLLEPGTEEIPDFLKEHQVRVVASMPCYLEENVHAQRGAAVYEKSIEALKRLNRLGYGTSHELFLDLVYNPGGPFLPPTQSVLEEDYRRELGNRFGVTFTRLLTIANMPLGRFGKSLERARKKADYEELLRRSFNPSTLSGLMCRHQISVGWDGTLYDCDFNLALNLPVDHGAPDHIRSFKLEHLSTRRIVTGEHCFGCTAGSGSSCSGALI